jgi:hypothetical protein
MTFKKLSPPRLCASVANPPTIAHRPWPIA